MSIEYFKTGHTYWTRSACDWSCIFSSKVHRRTKRYIWVEQLDGSIVKRGVYVVDGVEHCKPYGTYSMCPRFRADMEVMEAEAERVGR